MEKSCHLECLLFLFYICFCLISDLIRYINNTLSLIAMLYRKWSSNLGSLSCIWSNVTLDQCITAVLIKEYIVYIDCRHYGAFLQCAAFVMRVENYGCSEDQIEEMAQDYYWFFMRGMPSSGGPTSTMDPFGTSVRSDWDGYKSSDMPSRSDMSDRSSDMSRSSDRSSDMSRSSDRASDMPSSSYMSDRPSDLPSSSARSDRPSDIQGSSDHMMDSSALHGSSSDDYLHSSRPPYDDHTSSSDMPGVDYRDSLPFICRGEFTSSWD